MRYVILEIGCLECRIPTHIIGTADELPPGVILISRWPGELGDSGWGGESVLAAIDLEDLP